MINDRSKIFAFTHRSTKNERRIRVHVHLVTALSLTIPQDLATVTLLGGQTTYGSEALWRKSEM